MPKPVILESAWEDISLIADGRARNGGAASALAFTNKLLESIDLLETMPMLAPLHHDPVLANMGYRKFVVENYLCVYRVIENVPTVYHVFYGGSDYSTLLRLERGRDVSR